MLVTLDKAVQLVLLLGVPSTAQLFVGFTAYALMLVYLGLVGHTLKPGLAPLAWTGLKLLRSSAS